MGKKRACVESRVTVSHNRRDGKPHKVLRCARMVENPNPKKAKSPACDRRLKDGGRSPGLIRPGPCPNPKLAKAGKSKSKRARSRK